MDQEKLVEVTVSLGAIFVHLKKLWEDCGFNAEEVTKKGEEVKKEIEDCIQHIASREEKKKQDMVEKLNLLRYEADKLSKELHIKFAPQCSTVPLCQALNNNESETRKLQKKSELEKEISEITKKEAELCTHLGETREINLRDTFPTREEIAAFNERLRTLQLRKDALWMVFLRKKSEISSVMREIECEPADEFERKVLADDAKFELSEENMRKLEELAKCYQNKIVERRKCIDDLRGNVANLWVRLQEDETYQGNFLRINTGIGISTVMALQEEIRRCEIKRRENIPLYLKTVRGQIQELWDKCCFGRRQRLYLLEFYSEGSSEPLLQRLKEEVSELRKFYCENSCLLHIATDYKQLWEKFLSLEEKSHDKDRLFKNRGGELLKEEKERNLIQKDLPKLENDLKTLVKKYEQQHNKPFIYYDEDINEMIRGRWTKLNETRQNYKSSWQKKSSSTKENIGTKRRLDCESTGSYKKRQLTGLPNPAELLPRRDLHQNVTRRRLLSPPPNKNKTFISGIREISDEACFDFGNGRKQEFEQSTAVMRREVFKDKKNSKIPVKPPRKNIMARHLRRKSNEFPQHQGCKPRRSSLPDIDFI